MTQALNGSSGNTFFVTSDIHYFRAEFAIKDQLSHVAQINSFGSSGYKWSSFFGINPGSDSDTIAAPRAVIVNGDVTLDSSPDELGAFRLMYESGTIAESLGMPGSGNYSWDLNKTHFVPLNLWAGDKSRLYLPPTSLPFPPGQDAPGIACLKQDLASKVGNSGRPLVIMQQFPMESVNETGRIDVSWSRADFTAFWDAVKDYNVIGMFGHTHAPAVNDQTSFFPDLPAQDSIGNTKILDGFTTGSGGENQKGDFIVARGSPITIWMSATINGFLLSQMLLPQH